MDDTGARLRNHWVSHIARHAHAKPHEVYLRFEGASVTWAQIHERIGAVAAALGERGIRAGDRVAIMMTNRPEFLESVLAASAIGAIAVPVNFRLAPPRPPTSCRTAAPRSSSPTRRWPRRRPRRARSRSTSATSR